MAKDYKALIADISQYTAQLRKAEPDAMTGFGTMAKAATREGTLDKKTKEFMALSIAVALRCDGCIGFHTKALKELGATREEVCEALAVCIYMGGGPSLMYAADALRSFDQFCAA